MKTRNIAKFGLVWLVLGLGLSLVQPVRGQVTYPTALFQYAIFYNGLLEFTDCAPLTINGRVHCNSNIFVGCPVSYSTLAFNAPVTCSGIITNPSWFGYSQSYYIAANITYNGTPSPGHFANVPQISLPIGTGNSIIQLPVASDSPSNVLSLQRYYYKADLVILVTNVTATNIATSVIIKNSLFDPMPLIFSYTNNMPQNTASWTNMSTNWSWFGASNWLTTNTSFYDSRQNQTNQVTQIDVGQFGDWIATNTNCLAKWNASTPFNGIIYVADMRTTNSMYMDCVRLKNGQTIPTVGATNSGSNSYAIPGLTVATINPLYILGLYNCPTTNNVSSTNTVGTAPCSVVCDALTILSPLWADNIGNSRIYDGIPPAASTADTVNTAIIAGNVPSTGSGLIQFSGGAQNLPRLLEDWGNSTLWLNTSLVNLYPSAQATVQFQAPPTNYNAPTREFSFDQNFSNLAMLPPGTPLFGQFSATVTLSNLNQVYNGSPLAPTVTTTPSGLSTSITYLLLAGNGILSTNAPVDAGAYFVTVTATNASYLGIATNVFYISPAPATVTLSNLSQTYDGAAESVSVTTVPPGLALAVTYNGTTNAPTNTGSYSVVATVNDTNYQGSATNTLVIVPPATTPIMLGGSTILADGTFQLSFTNTPGGSFSVLGSADPTAPVADWSLLGSAVEVSPGQFQFIDLDATNEARQFYLISSP